MRLCFFLNVLKLGEYPCPNLLHKEIMPLQDVLANTGIHVQLELTRHLESPVRARRVSIPESRAREMPHSSRARPLRKSSSACSANRSSLPACASRAIFSSKRAA